MNVEAIQTFVEAVGLGSFAAVARARGVAPSSVSRLVAELESELQVRLFHRTTRQLSLTEAGQAYLDRVGPLLEELDQARDVARNLGAVPRGLLRIAVSATFAQLHLGGWLPAFLTQYPELRVELALDARYTDLISEQIDVAIRLGHVQTTSPIAKKLCAMPRVIVGSTKLIAEQPLSKPQSLATAPCLLFPYHGPKWKFRDRRRKIIEVEPTGRIIAADGMLLRSLALQGEGYALLPRWLCAEELSAGTLVDVFPTYDVTATAFDASVWLLYASRSYLPLKVRVFVAFFSDLFRRGAPWDAPAR